MKRILTACVVASFCMLGGPSDAARPQPHILLILADDMGYSDLGSYGSGIETPALDRLAAEGLRFSQFHNAGRCCPSRAALLTGLYPHQAGVGHMLGKSGFPAYTEGLRDDTVTLPEALRGAGYHTFMSGKWHLGWADNGAPNARGFDRFYGSRGYVDSYFTVVLRTDVYLDDKIVNPAGQPPKNHLHPEREFYTTDTYTDYALHFIDEHLTRNPGQPFFGYLAYNAPHFPLHAKPEDTKKYRGRFRPRGWDPQRERRFHKLKAAGLVPAGTVLSERDSPPWDSFSEEVKDELDLKFALYCAIVDRLDQNVGRVVDHLRTKAILDDTLIVFLSDNGSTKETGLFGIGGHRVHPGNYDEWGRRGGWTSSLGQGWANVANTPFRRYKREAHEGGTATPCIVWAGRNVTVRPAPGTISHQVGHIIDLLPTLAEAAGARVPVKRNGRAVPAPEGKSLVPVFKGESIGERTLFWEHEGNRAVLAGPWKLVALRDEPWELYRLAQDRSETHDLAALHSERTTQLAGQWQQWAERVDVKPWAEVTESMAAMRQASRSAK